MKTLKRLLLSLVFSGLLISCSKEDEFLTEKSASLQYGYEKVNTGVKGLDQNRFVTMQVMNNNEQWVELKVHYRIIGQGPVDMIWIPGWTNPLTVFTKQFDYFRDKAKSIYVDLPGHGLSDYPEGVEYTMELMGDAIYAIAKKEGIQKFIGVGFSWGPTPLKFLEMKHPGMITQLILLDAGVTTWPPMTQAVREAQYAIYMAWTANDKKSVPKGDPEYDKIFEYRIDYPSWLLANAWYHCNAEEACQPYPWKIPIVGIWRNVSPADEAKYKLHFPGVDIHVIGGAYHVIQWFQKDVVNPMIEDHLADRPGNKY